MDRQSAVEEFILDQKMKGNSKLTITYYKHALGLFYGFAGDLNTQDIDLLLCKKYVVSLQEDERKNTITVQTYVRALRAYLRWLYDNEYITKNITEKLRLPKAQQKVQDVLTANEIRLLLMSFEGKQYEDVRNLCIIALMLGSGLRRNEAVTLEAKHIHLDEGYIIVTGKGNKQRNVPVGEYEAERIRAYQNIRPQTERFFVQKDGTPITDNTMKDFFRKLKVRTGIERLHAHLLRHTFATMYLNNGGNIYTLQTILGHTSLEMVKRYLHISPQYVIANFSKLSPLDNP